MEEKLFDFGEWFGYERSSPGIERRIRLEVLRKDSGICNLVAIKLSNDSIYIPPNETTWFVSLNDLKGYGRISDSDMTWDTYVRGKLTIDRPGFITFSWEDFGSISYKRDDDSKMTLVCDKSVNTNRLLNLPELRRFLILSDDL